MPKPLVVDVVSDAEDAVAGLDKVGRAATEMGDRVERASRDAEAAGDRLDRMAGAADTLDSKAAQATGSLGALSSGFELVGAEKYATGLQSAAMATDFFAGVGEGLNLVFETTAGAAVKAKVATVAKAAADKAAAAGAKVMAAAQWAVNAAMAANPIGLVVAAVVALVAIFIIAYKRSDRFRAIVQKAGEIGRKALGWVVEQAKKLIGWIGKLVSWVGDKWSRALGTAESVARRVWDFIYDRVQRNVEVAKLLVAWVRDKLEKAFDKAERVGERVWGALKTAVDKALTPVRAVRDAVESLVGWIKDIDWPDPPGWLKDLGGAVGDVFTSSTSSVPNRMGTANTSSAASSRTEIHLHGVLDSPTAAREIDRLGTGRSRRVVHSTVRRRVV